MKMNELKTNKKAKIVSGCEGVTLMELLVVAGLASFVFLSIGIGIQYFTENTKLAEVTAHIDQTMTQTEVALLKGPTCTMNLKGKRLSMLGPVNLNTIDLFDSHNNRGGPLLRVNEGDQYIRVQGLQLQYEKPLNASGSLIAANLNVDLVPNKKVIGAQSYRRTIGLNLNMLNGAIESCVTSDSQDGEQTCKIISGGKKTYDPATKTCVDRVLEQKFISEEKDKAVCPDGWTIKPSGNGACGVDIQGAVNSGFSLTTYQNSYAPSIGTSYTGSGGTTTDTKKAVPYMAKADAPNHTCYVQYVTALSTMPGYENWGDDFRATIVCQRPR